jgi:SAM-dependent methyltransferase
VHDLDKFPYPFENDYFDLIEADHILEHLTDPFKVMEELNRILKKDGVLIIRVPHFSRSMTHPQHKRGFDVTFPKYFQKEFAGGYTGTDFSCEKTC